MSPIKSICHSHQDILHLIINGLTLFLEEQDGSGAAGGVFGFGGLRGFGQTLRAQAEDLQNKAKESLTSAQFSAEALAGGITGDGSSENNNADSAGSGGGEDRESGGSSGKAPTKKNKSGTSSGSWNPLANRPLADISKEELMDVLQKMNKRLKGLTAVRATLTEKVKTTEKDKGRLLDLIRQEILTDADLDDAAQMAAQKNAAAADRRAAASEGGHPGGDGMDISDGKVDEIGMLQLAWRAADERQQFSLRQMQNEYQVIAMQHQAEVERIKVQADEEKEKLLQITSNGATLSPPPFSTDNNDQKKIQELSSRIQQMETSHVKELSTLQSEHDSTVKAIQAQLQTKEADLEQTKQTFEQLKLQHQDQLSQQTQRTDEQLCQLSSRIQQMEQSHAASLAKVQTDHQQAIARSETLLEQTGQQLEKTKKTLADMEVQHRTELSQQTEKSSQDSAQLTARIKQIELSHHEAITDLQKQRNDAIQRTQMQSQQNSNELTQQLQNAIKKANDLSTRVRQMEQSHADVLANVQSQHKEQLQLVDSKSQHITEELDRTKQLLADLRLQHQKDATAQSQLLQSRIDEAVKATESRRDEELQRIQSEWNKTREAEWLSAKNELERKLNNTHMAELEKLRAEASAQEFANKNSEAELVTLHQQQIQQLRNAHTTAMNNTKQQMDTELAKEREATEKKISQLKVECQEQVDALHRESAKKLERAKIQLKDEHTSKLQLVRSELNKESQRKLELAKAELDDVKATLSAAKNKATDEEKSWQSKIEDALSKQRLSMEKQMQSQHGTFDSLQLKYNQLESSLEQNEKKLAEAETKILEGRNTMERTVSELQREVKETSAQADEWKRQFESAQQTNASTSNGLTKQLDAASSAKDALEKGMSALKEKHSIELKSVRAELGKATQAFHAEMKVLKQNHTDQVKANLAVHESAMTKLASDWERKLSDSQTSHRQEIESIAQKNDALRTSMTNEHAKQLDKLREEEGVKYKTKLRDELNLMVEGHGKEMEKLMKTHASGMNATLDEHNIEIQKLESDWQQRLDEEKRSTASQLEKALQSKAGDVRLALETEHENQLCKIREGAKKEIEERIRDTTSTLNAQNERKIMDLEKKHREEVETLEKRVEAAKEYVQNLRSATAEKMKSAEKEREDDRSRMQDEKNSAVASLQEQLETLQKESKKQQDFVKKEAEDSKTLAIKTLEDKHKKAMAILEKRGDETLNAIKAEYESRLKRQKEELETKVRQYASEKDSASATIQKQVEEKMKKILAEHTKELNHVAKERENALKATAKDNEKRLAELNKKHSLALAAAESEKNNLCETLKKETEDKVTEARTKSQAEKSALEQKLSKHADGLKAFFDGKLKTMAQEHSVKISEKESELADKNHQISSIATELKSANDKSTKCGEENENLREELSAQKSIHQSLKLKIDELQRELKSSAANSAATASSLLEEQEKLGKSNKDLKVLMAEVAKERDLKIAEVGQMTKKLAAAKGDLDSMAEAIKEKDRRLEYSAKQQMKLNAADSELNLLREEVNKLKLEQAQSSGLLDRLQTEKEESERKHGQRTALVGMLEAQLSDSNESNNETQAKLEAALYDLSIKDEELQNAKEQVQKSQRLVAQAQAQAQAQTARKLATESSTSAVHNAESAKQTKMINMLQKDLQSLQQQMARKSTAAQRLLNEREAECIELRKANKALQEEVDKGTLSDRRIFELAAQQSNRETIAAGEIEIRNKQVQSLTEKLISRDGALAAAEFNVQKVEDQVQELCRVQRREDVNLDYLKSIVVQYLSKPPGSSERAALLPVLATLLQFDDSDYRSIEEGKKKVNWLWGGVEPTYITAPGSKTAQGASTMGLSLSTPEQQHQRAPVLSGSSAEVVISRDANSSVPPLTRSQKLTRTSLQF